MNAATEAARERAKLRRDWVATFEPPRRQTWGSMDAFMREGGEITCPFCRRLHGYVWDEELQAHRQGLPGEPVPDRATEDVEEWDDHVAFRPLNPVTPLHTLVIPKRHIPNHTFGTALAETMVRAAELARGLEWAGWDTNIIVSSGKAATQTVEHLHVHVIPRAKGDGLMVPWGTTGDPNAPHDCPAAQRGRDVAQELRRQLRAVSKRAGEDADGAPGEYERLAAEVVDGRIAELEARVRELGGVVPPRRATS